jgi:hypothetical protein
LTIWRSENSLPYRDSNSDPSVVLTVDSRYTDYWSEIRRCFIATAFYFILEYTIRKVQENQVGLKLNRTHQLLVYTDNLNLLEDIIDTIKKGTAILFDASKEDGPEKNAEKCNHIVLSRHQNAGRNHHIKRANRLFENVTQLK